MLHILPAECLLSQVVNYASHSASRMRTVAGSELCSTFCQQFFYCSRYYVSLYVSRMLTAAGSELCFTLCQQNLSKPTMFVRISPLKWKIAPGETP